METSHFADRVKLGRELGVPTHANEAVHAGLKLHRMGGAAPAK